MVIPVFEREDTVKTEHPGSSPSSAPNSLGNVKESLSLSGHSCLICQRI